MTPFAFVLALVILYFIIACGCASRSGFSNAPDARLAIGDNIPLYNGTWLVSACTAPANSALRVYNSARELYVPVPKNGKIESLPAYLGGLPAHDAYRLMFMTAGDGPVRDGPVRVECVPHERAARAVSRRHHGCMRRHPGDSEYCDDEFPSL